MSKRVLVPLLLLLALALALTACGGGSNDEDKITEVIEKSATTSDPENCTELETQRFAEQNSEKKGKAAIEACEEEAKSGEEQAKGVKVSNVSVNEEKATADVKFEGGSLNSQALEVALVEEGGDWKLDQIEGFAEYNGKALAAAFESQFEEYPEGLSAEQVKCIADKVAALSKSEAEVVVFGGSPKPIIELAKSCA